MEILGKESLKNFFNRIFVHNFKLKILSLFVSFLLWLNISAKEVVQIETIRSVEARNIPKGYILEGIEPNFVKITLEGKRIYISSVEYINLDVFVDCSSVKEGVNILPVKIVNLSDNTDINIVSVNPNKVRVFIKSEVKKKIRHRRRHR